MEVLRTQIQKDEIRIEKLVQDRSDIQAEFDELEQNYYNLIQVKGPLHQQKWQSNTGAEWNAYVGNRLACIS